MKKVFLYLLAPALLVLSSCYRTNTNPGPVYESYDFVENFNNNTNGWSFNDPDNYARGYISGGTYKMEYFDGFYPAYYISQSFSFNYKDNFIIETKFGSDNEMGLLFGFDDARSVYGYSINIDYDGNFRMYDEGGNGYGTEVEEIYPLSTSSVVRRMGDWNVLRMQQTGNLWIVSINGYEVFRMEAQNIKGSGVGYVLSPFTEGEADYLDISGYY